VNIIFKNLTILFCLFLAACSGSDSGMSVKVELSNLGLSVSSSGSYDYGLVNLSSTPTNTFTISNRSSSSSISSISVSSLTAPYTFLGGTYPGTGGDCSTTLATSATCSIVIEFAPVAAVTNNDTVIITYIANGSSKTSSITLTGLGTTYDAPVAAAITPASFNEDTESIITLSYTDTESDLATACSITPTNVTETQTCACSAGSCTVGVTGTANYNGAASFTYTVTANAQESNSVTATLSVSAVDDAPVSTNVEQGSVTQNVQFTSTLSYTDIESVAISCTVSAFTSASETVACACAVGVCTVGIRAAAVGSFTFDFTVRNGLTSNTSQVRYDSVAPVVETPVIALSSPSTSPAISTQVIFLVSNVSAYHTVKVYTDSSCTTEVGTSDVNFGNSTVSVSVGSISVGSLSYYAKSFDVYSNFSNCSSAVTYERSAVAVGIALASLVSPASNPSAQYSITIEFSNVDATYNDINIYSDSSCITLLGNTGNITGATIQKSFTNLAIGTHPFYVTTESSSGVLSACSADPILTYIRETPTLKMSTVGNIFNASASNSSIVRVSYDVQPDKIFYYSDEGCITQKGVDNSPGETFQDNNFNSIPAGVGQTLYIRLYFSGPGDYTDCSPVAYIYSNNTGCPTGYVAVPGDIALGTVKFCVSKYEMRDVAGVASATPTGSPWTTIGASNAQAECTSLGARYDIISNSEWMAISRNIEAQAINWSGGSVGSGCLYKGNTEANGTCSYSANGLDSSSAAVVGDRDSRGRLILSNGNPLWDLAGNLKEWVDYDGSTAGFQAGPSTCHEDTWTDLPSVSCAAMSANDFDSSAETYDYRRGVGQFIVGKTNFILARGGAYTDALDSVGVYTTDMSYADGFTSSEIGFRCVYRL
jgi:hypothetical protein